MHVAALTAPEQRVLGCLIEKRVTTPDQYPLTLNALRLACNQSTNRDPVTAYTDDVVNAAAQRLSKYGLTRLASGHSSRAVKYRHLAEAGLGLDDRQLAVLAVLLLRGPQTPGELNARTERLASFASPADVEQVLAALIDRGYVARLQRRPGQKEERYAQLLGEQGEEAPPPPASGPATPEAQGPATPDASRPATSDAPGPARTPATPELEARVMTLERAVAELRAQLDELGG